MLLIVGHIGGPITIAVPVTVEEGEYDGDDPDRAEEVRPIKLVTLTLV